jgi:hypothetical protein
MKRSKARRILARKKMIIKKIRGPKLKLDRPPETLAMWEYEYLRKILAAQVIGQPLSASSRTYRLEKFGYVYDKWTGDFTNGTNGHYAVYLTEAGADLISRWKPYEPR